MSLKGDNFRDSPFAYMKDEVSLKCDLLVCLLDLQLSREIFPYFKLQMDWSLYKQFWITKSVSTTREYITMIFYHYFTKGNHVCDFQALGL